MRETTDPPPRVPTKVSGSGHEAAPRSPDEAVLLGEVVPGPLPRRVAAFVIDSALGSVVELLYLGFTAFQITAQLYLGGTGENEISEAVAMIRRPAWVALAVATLLGLFYRWSMHTTFGWTLGKRLLGLRVAGSEGGPAGPLPLLVREIALSPGYVFATLTVYFVLDAAGSRSSLFSILPQVPLHYGIAFAVLLAVAFWRLDRRSIHDLVSRTQVVRAAGRENTLRFNEDSTLIPRRILAFGIDFVLGLIVIFAAGIWWGGVAMISAIALPVLNRTLLPAKCGFTLGKWAMGLQIVRGDGSRAWTIQLLVREFVLLVLLYAANLVTILGGWAPATAVMALLLLYIAIHRKDRHSFHDLVAGTYVARISRDRGISSPMPGVEPQS